MIVRAWYCRRCQMALKVDPPTGAPRACRCEVPILPFRPTIVHLIPSAPKGAP